jgi:hypothetical protein
MTVVLQNELNECIFFRPWRDFMDSLALHPAMNGWAIFKFQTPSTPPELGRARQSLRAVFNLSLSGLRDC